MESLDSRAALPQFPAMKPLLCLTSICAGFFLAGCAKETPLDEEAWRLQAAESLKPFKQELMGTLTAGLEQGPEEAVSICVGVARQIAARHSSEDVVVGRTTDKLRNGMNAPREWIKPLLQAYKLDPEKTEASVVRLAHGGVGVVEPIYLNAMCLMCHGSDVAPSIAGTIRENYPADAAMGYELGDFRGLFWVEYSEK